MTISVFDLFKIGIGPSSSHTVGPMRAARTFVRHVVAHLPADTRIDRLRVDLYGSLGATGIGHGTDRAVVMGLMGYQPDTVDPRSLAPTLDALRATGLLQVEGLGAIAFLPERDITFNLQALAYHPNGLTLTAFSGEREIACRSYYSVGGGFIVSDEEVLRGDAAAGRATPPYDFKTAAELLQLCKQHGLSISGLMLAREHAWADATTVQEGISHIWDAMKDCIAQGMVHDGLLPGGLNVPRRALRLHQSLRAQPATSRADVNLSALDWINLYALAVNEENAAGGRVVTAPTNGAAGIIPAVLQFYMTFNPKAQPGDVARFLLAAGAIGILCKTNASISGAEVGCQGEVGSACAMAAAGLAEVMGGSPEQVENAAEIGLEHNLGLTCDPIGGLVQIPCIERNAIAAVKAVNAAQMALRTDGTHCVSLDQVIRTMRDTGRDMSHKYKETSLGGLAVSIVAC